VERLEADLLGLTDGVDRNDGEIWFAYADPLITREEQPSLLARLEQHGWLRRTNYDRWLTTEAGQTVLSEARNWAIAVRTVADIPESYRHYLVSGALAAGSPCFLDEYWPHFSIIRDGAESGYGALQRPAETEVESDEKFLRLEETC
jgi:hypothetical protein